MPGMYGPPPPNENAVEKLNIPKSAKEIPGFVLSLVKKFTTRLLYIFKLVWETRPWILFVMMATAVIAGVVPVISAKISAELLNRLASAANPDSIDISKGLITLLIIQAAFQFVTSAINQVSSILNSIAGELVVNHVNVKIMKKAKEIDMADFDRPEFYEKLENASREAGHRPIQILRASFQIISILITMISFIIALAAVSVWAPIVLIIIAIPSAIISFIYRKKNFNYMRFRSKDRRQLAYYSGLMTDKDLVKEVKMFGLGDTFIDRYQNVFTKYFDGFKKLFVSEGLWQIAISFVSTIVHTSFYVILAIGVCKNRFLIGDYSFYGSALSSISSNVASLISVIASVYEGTLFIDNLITFMNREKTISPSLENPREVQHHIAHRFEFKNVSFRYPGSDHDVIHNVNLVIEEGSTVVLVGLNGAGKTTLLKLLTRLYDPTEGTILLDGYDIKEYKVEDVYSIFGIIFQDFGKYAVTVSENIRFGQISKPYDINDIMKAAEESNSTDFINKLPKKYDTPLMKYFESSGIELSIGQWQKLSIARAFYSDTDVLILDEPTASLDAIAESEIYRQFDDLRKDRTTIFVSHRLSSATTADKIVVLEYGKIVEIGSHRELLEKHGEYYKLFTAQAERYLSAGEFMDNPPPRPDFPNPPPFIKR